MKKFLSIFTVLLMLTSSSVCAAVDFTANCRYDSQSNGFVVYGTTNDTKSGDEITIEAYLNNEFFDTIITETVLKDGVMSYESDAIAPSVSAVSGNLEFKIFSANQSLSNVVATAQYYGIDVTYEALKNIVSKMSAGDFTGIRTILNSKNSDIAPYNYELLGVDFSLIKDLSQGACENAGKYAKTVTVTLPENITSQADKQLAGEAVKEFKDIYAKMALVGNFTDLSSTQGVADFYNKYYSILDLNGFNPTWYNYFEDNYQTSEFYTILSKESKSISEIDQIKERLLAVGGLTAVKRGNATKVQSVVNDFNSLMTISYNLNDFQKSSVYASLAGQEFASLDKLSEKYNELAAAFFITPSVPVTPGVGSSPGNNVTLSPITDNNTSKKDVFTDMADAKWAETAVNYLYEKGIVSGKTKSEFYPNDNITRAEFVKLLVMASGETLDANTKVFGDVNASDWYYAYVNKAYAMGLVKGNDLGNFNPNAQITREDMATMIYRLIGNGETKGDFNVFADAVNISNYAKNAVSYLYASNIINGMGDGSFSPKSMATRAQAAQIIYNIVK